MKKAVKKSKRKLKKIVKGNTFNDAILFAERLFIVLILLGIVALFLKGCYA